MEKRKFNAVEWIDIKLLGVVSFDSEELRGKYKKIILEAVERYKAEMVEYKFNQTLNASDITKAALIHFGPEEQKKKLIEEMAELMQALLKDTNVAEEIADVQIVLDQIKLLYLHWITFQQIKLKSLEERINVNKEVSND